MDETAYLLATEANRKALLNSIYEINSKKPIAVEWDT